MDRQQALEKARRILDESRIYEGVINLLKWDMMTYMPEAGRPWRVRTSTYMTSKQAELFITPEGRALAGYFKDMDVSALESDIDKAVVRRFLANYETCAGLPLEMQEEISNAHFASDAAWNEARRRNDYQIWKPALQHFFDLKYRAAEMLAPNKHPLETMINVYDEDLTVDMCNRLFGELKHAVSEIMFKVAPACAEIDDSFLAVMGQDLKAVDDLMIYACHRFGYTADMASFAKIVHGWSATIGPRDCRVTTNRSGGGHDTLFTGAHEMGHSLYGRGSSEEVVAAGIWGGMKCSAQESQSRFYENIICRSPEFWEFFYPFVQERFPELRSVDKNSFFRAVMKVKPSLKRTTADELTYNLHPIIRYEIERDLFERKLSFDKIPEVWADKYEESLGIRPANDVEGCLQDIHWTEDFGKFQSYTMGNIFDGQLLRCILTDIPDFYRQIEQGRFADVHSWFTDKIYRHGYTYPTVNVMERATGESIKAEYYINYIRSKYYTLFGVED